jgi:hypothetical protein
LLAIQALTIASSETFFLPEFSGAGLGSDAIEGCALASAPHDELGVAGVLEASTPLVVAGQRLRKKNRALRVSVD